MPKREGLFVVIKVAATITTVIISTRVVFDGVAKASGRVKCALHGSTCISVRYVAALPADAACMHAYASLCRKTCYRSRKHLALLYVTVCQMYHILNQVGIT